MSEEDKYKSKAPLVEFVVSNPQQSSARRSSERLIQSE
jgi:hypothetical protein